MGDRKTDADNKVNGAGKGVARLFGKAKAKAVDLADRNDDGKFDFDDVTHVANAVGNAVKGAAAHMRESAAERARLAELATLMPLFEADVEDASFALSKLLRICKVDKRRAESEVCKGAIGYYTEEKDFKIVNIFLNETDRFGISFYPDKGYEFYYVDPCDRNRYIALDEYFAYMKLERINELQRIAQNLGAKHFKVTYKEEKASFSKKSIDGEIKAGAKVNASKKMQAEDFSRIEIAAEMDCPGHAPNTPSLKYLSKDASIQNLITLRMDEQSPIMHQKFTLKMSNSSGIRESDAIKIDAIIKKLRCTGSITVSSEAKNESRRYLEYEIDF